MKLCYPAAEAMAAAGSFKPNRYEDYDGGGGGHPGSAVSWHTRIYRQIHVCVGVSVCRVTGEGGAVAVAVVVVARTK